MEIKRRKTMKIGNWARKVKRDTRFFKSENLPHTLDITEIREVMDVLWEESNRDGLERAATLVLDEKQQLLLINSVVGTQRRVQANYVVPKGYTIFGVVHTHPAISGLAFGGGDMAEAIFYQHHISIVLSGKETFAMVRTDMTPDEAAPEEVRSDAEAARFAYRAEGHSPRQSVYLAALDLCSRYGFAMYHGRGKKTIKELNAHHIVQKKEGGTDTPKNGITLCKKCHDELHKGKWNLEKKPITFKYPMHLMQGKWYIYELLRSEGIDVKRCVGWMTAYWRKQTGIEKSHPNDAIAMITRNYMPKIASLEYTILPKRARVWEDNPTKKSEEKFSFRHYDLVKAKHRTKGWVIGSVRSLKEKVMTLRTKFDDNFPVSYRKSSLLFRFNRIVYSY